MNTTEYTSSPPTADDDRAASDDICITTAPATDIPSQLTKAQSSAPTLEEVLTQTSTTDTLISSIAGTVEDFAGKDEAFRKELRKRLFQLVLKKYAWWSARLVHECNVHNYDLEREITELQQAEVERDRLHAKLSELFAMVNRAVELSRQF
ncbi:hypothetical protein M404DRAFT_475069 [Pisolithus tinctorius Marx 270]|uniref:Uncharacterized protein n=1 Tax=Pisolithus tinctorius Marx 270 TaxID=870435 RepID=A0A0C3JYZ6_PISTI|nr:hypothetical protein M404DRAFT_475069 [Pisolithus tinctorius Marx 270]